MRFPLLPPPPKQMKQYVVFVGRKPGIYATWDECRAQIEGVPGAKFCSCKSEEEARAALRLGSGKKLKEHKKAVASQKWRIKLGEQPCIAVDAACAGVPGPTEYRGVLLPGNTPIFASKLYRWGTNNIGEFLGIVAGLQWMEARSLSYPLYSDSAVGISWLKAKECRTKLEGMSPDLAMEVETAEHWLRTNPSVSKLAALVRKWPTSEWGEIPADYARK